MTSTATPRVLHLRSSGGMLGAEQVVLSLCKHSSQFGYEPCLAVTQDEGETTPLLYSAAQTAGIEAYKIECRRSLDFRALVRLRQLVEQLDIDILHCHGYREDFYAVMSRSAAKLIATNHLWKRSTAALRLYAWLDARLMRRFDRVVAVSAEILEELRARRLRESRLTYIPNGIDTDRFDEAEFGEAERAARKAGFGLEADDIVLSTIGSVTSEKGHRHMLRALAETLSAAEKIFWLVVGDGPEADSLRQLAAELGVSHRVRFLGRREDIAEILSITDIFVLPSLSEGLPIALLEAMASGTACVATRVGDVATVLGSGTRGVVVERGDSAALAAAMKMLVADPVLRSRLGKDARQHVLERYSSLRMAKDYCRLYDELLAT